MATLVMVTGPTGVGKTTYSNALAGEMGAIRFSIDPWMQTLFSKDMTSLDYDWMIERVYRCYEQIWEVAAQILSVDGKVILDLGFTTRAQRKHFFDKASDIGIAAQLHYLVAPPTVRRKRVKKRNKEKNPVVYSLEVTDEMFDFMEPRFEVPTEIELKDGLKVNTT
jgi:predicted kinase